MQLGMDNLVSLLSIACNAVILIWAINDKFLLLIAPISLFHNCVLMKILAERNDSDYKIL